MRPLIGISTSELRHPLTGEITSYGEPAWKELALGLKYPRAIERAGGVPVVIPPLLDLDYVPDLLAGLSGLLLSGGPDIDPTHYHETAHKNLGETFSQLDLLELTLLHEADRIDLPVLGVCRGQQMINVYRGGTLYQDLPNEFPSLISHRQSTVSAIPMHTITIAKGSILEPIIEDNAAVNSYHHQAVHLLGEGLRPVAWAADRVIEAVHDRERSLLLGVQWHPEALLTPKDQSVFDLLISKSKHYHRARP